MGTYQRKGWVVGMYGYYKPYYLARPKNIFLKCRKMEQNLTGSFINLSIWSLIISVAHFGVEALLKVPSSSPSLGRFRLIFFAVLTITSIFKICILERELFGARIHKV